MTTTQHLAPSNPLLALPMAGASYLALTPQGRSLVEGDPILQGNTPHTSTPPAVYNRPIRPRAISAGGLDRGGTLLTHGGSAEKNGRELKRLLGKGETGRKVTGGADGKKGVDEVRLEAGVRKARVEIDILLERDVVVEGGEIKGRMDIKVREGNKKDGPVEVGDGKVRLVGFEGES